MDNLVNGRELTMTLTKMTGSLSLHVPFFFFYHYANQPPNGSKVSISSCLCLGDPA